MSWFETLTKETFQEAVREAVKAELDTIKSGTNNLGQQVLMLGRALEILKIELDDIKRRITRLEDKVGKLEHQIVRVSEDQTLFADRIGRLEGIIEGLLRSLIAELKLDLYEKFRGELPAKASSPKKTKRVAA